MKTNSTCCGSTTSVCESYIAELPRYYPRQLITPDDLTLEQNYFRERLRRHNRVIHGWGVVCGALVCPITKKDVNGFTSVLPWQVQVERGYVLGPYGDEIILDCVRTIDLRTSGVSGITGDPCVDVPDPWCSEVTVPRTKGTLYIAVKYKQTMTRPVRVQPVGCGCDDNSCECSRLIDGYELGVLTCCPTEGQTAPKRDDLFRSDLPNCIPSCPDCPTQPWVVLASVDLASDGTIKIIDNRDCRRLVASFGSFWWQCSGNLSTSITDVKGSDGSSVRGTDNSSNPIAITRGDKTGKVITVLGNNLDPSSTYILGNGILVTNPVATSKSSPGTSVDLTVSADPTADEGPHMLIVLNKDCSTATFSNVINVTPAPPAKVTGKQIKAKSPQ